MADRRVYYVSPKGVRWKVTLDGIEQGEYDTQAAAITEARIWAKNDWDEGVPSQIRVQRPDGTFRIEWTYGEDPNPPKG